VLILKHKGKSYPVHFAHQSIDRGELSIGEIRTQASRKLNVDPMRIKLFYKGRNLKDDNRLARADGFRSGAESEILCVAGDSSLIPEQDDDDDDDDEEEEEQAHGDVKPKRKRNRNKKKKGRKNSNRNSGASTPTLADSTSMPAPPPAAAPPKIPVTAMEKLDALAHKFHVDFLPLCIQFTASPPPDSAKREYEYKKLSETILSQILLKLDGVETEGDADARAKRKQLVKEVQGILTRLDEVAQEAR